MLALLGAVAAIVFVPAMLSAGVVGQPVVAAMPTPPAVGSCVAFVQRQPTVVDCAQPHRGEVTASWAAEDPQRLVDATPMGCMEATARYLGALQPAVVDGWTLEVLRTTDRLIAAPATDRVEDYGWNACLVRAPDRQLYTGVLTDLGSAVDRPAVFGRCGLDSEVVNCTLPHTSEQLGSTVGIWSDTIADRAAADRDQAIGASLQAGCQQLAAQLTGNDDPTYGGQLAVDISVEEIWSNQTDGDPQIFGTNYQAVCSLVYAGPVGQTLTGSVVGLGTATLPLG